MKRLSEPALESLGESIRYSVDFLERNLSLERRDLFGETAIQVLRDLYLLKKGSLLTGSICLVFDELGLSAPESDKELFLKMEKCLRNEEDYQEFTAALGMEEMERILVILRETAK